MGVELVEEVHDGIRVQGGGAYHHVLLTLGTMGTVAAAQLLALHPREGQLFKLYRK